MGKQCLKCGYVRQAEDTAPEYECPKCGVIYAKAEAAATSSAMGTDGPVAAVRERSSNSGAGGISVTWIVLAVVFLGVAWMGYTGFTKYKAKQAATQAAEKNKAEGERLMKAFRENHTNLLLTVLKGQLKDPESAQIRDLQYYETYIKGEGGFRLARIARICGAINGKNSYGGYVGYRDFYATAFPPPSPDAPIKEYVFVEIFNPEWDEARKADFATEQKAKCADVDAEHQVGKP